VNLNNFQRRHYERDFRQGHGSVYAPLHPAWSPPGILMLLRVLAFSLVAMLVTGGSCSAGSTGI
jgi:hypothetical protein